MKRDAVVVKILAVALVFALMAVARPSPVAAQSVQLQIESSEQTDEGFLVKGTVTGSGLNPEGQLNVSNTVSVIADIKEGPDSVYPKLPKGWYVRSPAGAETPYTEGSGPGGTMTKAEYEGKGISSVTIASFGLGETPVEFEGTIPLEYAGKTVRIRASLKHYWSGTWPAMTFHHDTGYEGKLEGKTATPETGKEKVAEGDGSSTQADKMKSAIAAAKKINDMIKDAIAKAKSKRKGETTPGTGKTASPESSDEARKEAGMTILDKPETEPKLSSGESVSQQAKQKGEATKEKIKQLTEGSEETETVEIKTPYGKDIKIVGKDEKIPVKKEDSPGWFWKEKYYFNKYVLDKVIDKLADTIPIGGLYKDYVKSEKDANLFSGDEATKKTQLDLGVSKKAAELYNGMSGVEDSEKALSPAKNLIPSTPLTKPFELILNHMGVGVKKEIANQYREEYELAKRLAEQRRRMGQTWSDTMKGVEQDVEEQTLGEKTLVGDGWINTGYLNTMSKDTGGAVNPKTQKGRIKMYIMIMQETGELK